jgi:low temperature requirement protein LtrA
MPGGTDERSARAAPAAPSPAQPPPAAPSVPALPAEGKRVSWVELFYDLVLVFAITKVSHELTLDVSWPGLLNAWAVFTPFWWSWVGTSILSNLTDLDHPKNRLRLFAIVLITSLMTIAAPTALGGRGLLFALLYLMLRLLLVWWSADIFGGLRLNPFSVSAFFTAPMLLLTSALPMYDQRIAWAALMTVELSTTWMLRRRLTHIRVDVAHMPERFGLVVILALGMPLVDSSQTIPDRFSVWHAAALVGCFLLVAGMWWIYFDFTHSAIAHRLRTEQDHSRVVRELLAYGHYGLFACISAVAVGIRLIIAHPRSQGETGGVVLMCTGTALYLGVFLWPRWGLPRVIARVRFLAAVAVVPAGVFLGTHSGLALMGALVVVVCTAAATESVLLRAAPACFCGCRPARLRGLPRALAGRLEAANQHALRETVQP